MQNIAIIGSGRHAEVLKEMVLASDGYLFKGFVGKSSEDKTAFNEKNIFLLKEQKIQTLLNGIGNVSYPWFENTIQFHLNAGFRFLSYRHPSCVIATSAQIGSGTVVMENAVVKRAANIGKFCLLNSLSVVSHDCVIEDYVHVSLGAKVAGGCTIGQNSFLGVNASVIQNVRIGKNVIIGAGAVVLENLPDNVVVVGNPCKIIRQRS